MLGVLCVLCGKCVGKFGQRCVLGFDHFAGLDAGRADAYPLIGPVDSRAYGTQIHIPAAAAHVVRVADGVSKLRSLAADFTYLGHDGYLQKVTRKGTSKKASER